ncbi:hypothetical protein A2U01_0076951, partial [Trifolium medium]|nr:hypothetical protein [Trifolium medium]
ENYQELQNTFPAFDLEDMVGPEEEGDVMDQRELGSDWDFAEEKGETTPPARAKRKRNRPKWLNGCVVASHKKGSKKK